MYVLCRGAEAVWIRGYNLAPKASSARDDTPRSASRILNGWSVQHAFRSSGRTTSEDTGERKTRKRRPASERKADQQSHGSGKEKGQDRAGVQRGSSGPSISSKGKGKAKDGKSTELGTSKPPPRSGIGGDVPRIMPHETLGEYNRRVEDLLRPGVTKAMKESKIRNAQERLKKGKGKVTDDNHPASKAPGGIEIDSDGGGVGDSDGGAVGLGRGTKKRKRAFDELPTRKRLNDIAQAPPILLHLKKAPQKAGSVWSAKGRGKSGLSAAQERILAEERERVVKRYREMKAEKEAKKAAPDT